MNLIEFPEQTVVIAKDQPEYLPLPAHRFAGDPQGRIACCWRMTWRERLRVLWTGLVWHEVLTFGGALQPQRLSTEKPDMSSNAEAQARGARSEAEGDTSPGAPGWAQEGGE